jgi:hypothetical protein
MHGFLVAARVRSADVRAASRAFTCDVHLVAGLPAPVDVQSCASELRQAAEARLPLISIEVRPETLCTALYSRVAEPMQQIAVAILSPHSKMYHERAPFLVSQINMDKDPFAWEDVKLHRQERTVQRSSITSRTPWILAPCPSHSGC